MMEPHPQRCETCKKFSETPRPAPKKGCRWEPELWCSNFDGKPRWISRSQMHHTSEVGCASHSSAQNEREKVLKQALHDIIDDIDGRFEGMKNFYETPSDERTGTDREAYLMFGEVRIIKECMDIILKHYGLQELHPQGEG